MSCRVFGIFIFLISILSGDTAFGGIKNLGVAGETYPVVEPDVVAELKEQAVTKNPFKKDELLEQMKKYQPRDIHPLPRAAEDRTFLVDMTYSLDRDLRDGDGKIIYPMGYTFNPLDYVSFPGGLMVIAGDNSSHLKWFKKTPYANDHRVRLLVSSGYAFTLIEQLKRSVFYLTDEIARRLQLSTVPSLVVQKGDKLQVREFFVPEEENDENR